MYGVKPFLRAHTEITIEAKLTIGKVAAAAMVNVETIRFYQRRGLLIEPARPPGGQRYYDASVIARIRFIKRAQHLGFSLDEITGLLALGESNLCSETHAAASKKLNIVEQRIDDLMRIRSTLKKLIGQCKAGSTTGVCPIIETLLQDASGAGPSLHG